MSEEIENIEATEAENQEEVDTQEPTVKVAEMKRRLEKEQEKAQQQIDEIKANQEKAIQEAYEKAKAEAQMSADELREYKEKEAQRKYQAEIEARDAQIAELTSKQKQREIRDESINKLNELNITVNEHSLALVGADSLDDMSAKATQLAELLKEQKEDYAQSTPPRSSGGLGSGDKPQTVTGILDNAKITEF